MNQHDFTLSSTSSAICKFCVYLMITTNNNLLCSQVAEELESECSAVNLKIAIATTDPCDDSLLNISHDLFALILKMETKFIIVVIFYVAFYYRFMQWAMTTFTFHFMCTTVARRQIKNSNHQCSMCQANVCQSFWYFDHQGVIFMTPGQHQISHRYSSYTHFVAKTMLTPCSCVSDETRRRWIIWK